MNDLVKDIARLEGEIRQLEASALLKEQGARADRAQRDEKKAELSRLRAVVHDAKVAHAVQGSMEAAQAAQQAAEASKTEAAAILESIKVAAESIKVKEAQLDGLIAKAAAEQNKAAVEKEAEKEQIEG